MTAGQSMPETQEARKMAIEIADKCQRTAEWYTVKAAQALGTLQENWISTCRSADLRAPTAFRGKCEDLLTDCYVLRLRIVEQADNFSNAAKSRLPAIKLLAGSDAETRSLAEHALDHWNGSVHPLVMRLFDNVEKLEDSIRHTLDTVEREVSQ